MVRPNESCTSSNLVFVMESTANMVSNYEAIKKNYILPILKHFDDKASSKTELINHAHSMQIVLILFHSADHSLGYFTECFPPVLSSQELIKQLDAVVFAGGGTESYAHVTEGLANALEAFADLKEMNSTSATEQYCFVISNSSPYQSNCIDSSNFQGMSLLDIGEQFYQKEIKLSVICPRHINDLRTQSWTRRSPTKNW